MTPVPSVSIISGYHDRAPLVAASVGSILAQTFDDFELILFDDASTDATAEALTSFDDPRIRLVRHETNVGFTRALLHAVELARGRFVAIHGAGDISHPSRISVEVEYLETNPDVGMVDVVNDLLTPDGRVHRQPSRSVEASVDLLRRETPFSHGSVMYRRTAYERAGGYHPAFTFSQDRDLWLRMARFTRLVRLPQALHQRRVHAAGASFSAKTGLPQAQHIVLGNLLVDVTREERERTLRDVQAEGVDAVVGASHPDVQAILRRRLRKLAKVGRWDQIDALRRHLAPVPSRSARAQLGILLAYASIARRWDRTGALARTASRVWDRVRNGHADSQGGA